MPAVFYGVGDNPKSIFSLDLDGDNDNDICVANNGSSNVSILLNNGNGIFLPAVNYATGSNPNSIFSADYDGDNDNDIATANGGSNDISILKNNGNGTFQPAYNYYAGDIPSTIFSADFNSDGYIDIVTANPGSFIGGTDNISIFLNNGDATFQIPINYITGDASISVFSSDLDGDRLNDLMVSNADENSIAVLLNTTMQIWHISTTGNDTTGDGSQLYPFATIQHGINMASDGDTVLRARS